MNLPSIFKSAGNMKGKPQQSTPGPREQAPQDMFGLGIQVFKIDAKKDVFDNSTAGKARKNMKNIENPTKKTSTPSSIAIKEKKTTASLLPSIYGTQQKEFKVSNTRTESILSKKKIQKRVTSASKIESIKEIVASKKAIPQPPLRNLAQDVGKTEKPIKQPQGRQNKTMDKIQSAPPPQQQAEQTQKIIKVNWRQSLNELAKFYTEYDEFEKQNSTKIGRKKNQQYLGQQDSFISAYIEKQDYFYTSEEQYEHFGIQNYNDKGFSHLNYQNFVTQ